mmetsp:Transcript_2631/g.9536  ORF Transcript_2631/g.9536 Transcript_2631/m.9536 type:complete len:93 (+) Transcript_2631:699-977(+)
MEMLGVGTASLEKWIDAETAVDVLRVADLKRNDYTTVLELLPQEVTPKNRMIMAYYRHWKRTLNGLRDSHPDNSNAWPKRDLPDSPWKHVSG